MGGSAEFMMSVVGSPVRITFLEMTCFALLANISVKNTVDVPSP